MGSSAPTSTNLKKWLQDNPTFEVVKQGSVQAQHIEVFPQDYFLTIPLVFKKNISNNNNNFLFISEIQATNEVNKCSIKYSYKSYEFGCQ